MVKEVAKDLGSTPLIQHFKTTLVVVELKKYVVN
jgi:hypothetical protein